MPAGYFDAASAGLLAEFEESALSDSKEEQMARFPEDAVMSRPEKKWQSSATAIYSNWLQYIQSRKADVSAFPVISKVYQDPCRSQYCAVSFEAETEVSKQIVMATPECVERADGDGGPARGIDPDVS